MSHCHGFHAWTALGRSLDRVFLRNPEFGADGSWERFGSSSTGYFLRCPSCHCLSELFCGCADELLSDNLTLYRCTYWLEKLQMKWDVTDFYIFFFFKMWIHQSICLWISPIVQNSLISKHNLWGILTNKKLKATTVITTAVIFVKTCSQKCCLEVSFVTRFLASFYLHYSLNSGATTWILCQREYFFRFLAFFCLHPTFPQAPRKCITLPCCISFRRVHISSTCCNLVICHSEWRSPCSLQDIEVP